MNADPKEHRHVCERCGQRFACHFGCLLDDDGEPLELESVCDDCSGSRGMPGVCTMIPNPTKA